MINSNVNAARIDDNFNGPMNNSTTSSGRFYLVPEDFVPLVQDVVDTHPGLTFLKEAAEFHSRYVHTVCYQQRHCKRKHEIITKTNICSTINVMLLVLMIFDDF